MLIRDIAQVLQANNIGVVGTDIFLGQTVDQPDNIIVLNATGGFAQDLPLSDVRLTAQVLVRDRSYEAAYSRIWQVYNLLDGGENRFIQAPSGRKMVAQAMQPPFFMERDANSRSIFIFNVSVWTNRD